MTDLAELVRRAKEAQRTVEFWNQDQVDEMVAAASWETIRQDSAEAVAQLAVDETRMGIYEHKLLKHQKKTLGTLRDLHGVRTAGVIEDDQEKGLIKIAKPVGVIGSLTPVTNATSTVAVKAVNALKTRNAIIFAPHPRAKKCCHLTCEQMRAGLKKVGAPVDLILNIEEPSIELSQELLRSVDLVVATGGGAMVKAAYSSGTPAYGVGAGNAVVIVDETADLAAAAEKIYLGKTFDHATSCSSENSAIIQEGIFDRMVVNFEKHGGYLCSSEEKVRLLNVLWPDGVHLNKDIVAQSAKKIAAMAELDVPEDITFLMVVSEKVGREDMFSSEKLSPVLTLWKYKEFDNAVELVQRITSFVGHGHSCGIHTTSDKHIMTLGERVHASRIMVNQPQAYGNSGNYDNGMPFTLTLGCGTWGGNITTENITWKHMVNVTWVSKPITPVVPNEDEIFGAYWAKYGK